MRKKEPVIISSSKQLGHKMEEIFNEPSVMYFSKSSCPYCVKFNNNSLDDLIQELNVPLYIIESEALANNVTFNIQFYPTIHALKPILKKNSVDWVSIKHGKVSSSSGKDIAKRIKTFHEGPE